MRKFEKHSERRRQQALERLGVTNPACACGEKNPFCLEAHHLEGKHFGDATVIECCNCHRKLSVAQDFDPKPTCDKPEFLECLAHALKGMQHLFAQLATICESYATELFKVLGITENQEDAR